MKYTLLMLLLLINVFGGTLKEKGFFAAIGFAKQRYTLAYENSSRQSFPHLPYEIDANKNIASLEAGYRYYYTRVFLRYWRYSYDDTKKEYYSLKGESVEMNVEYVPELYRTNENRLINLSVCAVFGVGVGWNDTSLTLENPNLLPAGVLEGGVQRYMEYGYQFGVLLRSEYGVELGFGVRRRIGDLLEYTDDQGDAGNKASFDLDFWENYVTLGYVF